MYVRGRFDGKVVVLDEPVPAGWVRDMPVAISVPIAAPEPAAPAAKPPEGPNQALMNILNEDSDLGLPPDFAEQHDHYIHGTPKR